jgi:hypothetical protein
VPDAAWITLLNLSGEVPIADYTPLGKVLVGFMGVFAVARCSVFDRVLHSMGAIVVAELMVRRSVVTHPSDRALHSMGAIEFHTFAPL